VGTLDDPTMTAELLLRLFALASDPRCNASLPQGRPVLFRRVPLVCVQFIGPLARPTVGTLDRYNRVEGRLQHGHLVDVGGGQEDRERDPLSVDHKMALRALFAAIRWILPGFFAPPGEGTVEASIAARLQSMRSAWPSRSRKTWWRRSQTPAFCQ